MSNFIHDQLVCCAIYFGRKPAALQILSWIIAHMSFALPVERLIETETLLAFHHPSPAYPLHILVVPKKPVPNFSALGMLDNSFIMDLLDCVQQLIRRFGLEKSGYRLIVNGGAYQEFPLLHFHLIADILSEE